MTLLVPKVLGVEEFSYWQLFIFYCMYAGFFHFGLNDGIYLRIGGREFNTVDFPLLASQMRYAIAFQTLIGSLVCVVAWLSVADPDRLFVICSAAFYLVSSNLFFYVGMILQATNRVAVFSLGVIIDKAIFLVIIAFALLYRGVDFRILVIGYICCRLIAVGYFGYQARQLFRGRGRPLRETLTEIGVNVRVGINLMLANIAGALVLGIGRQIIDMRWGIAIFGRVSLALSVIAFVLQFLGQVSIVLYPALRQTTYERQLVLATVLRSALDIVLPLIFLAYAPLSIMLSWWLPAYVESFVFLGLLMPLAIYEGKMQLLVVTYFKVLRWERALLVLNLSSMVLALICSLAGAYILDSVKAVVIAMVIAVVVRSVAGEYLLMRRINGGGLAKSSVSLFLVTLVYGGTTFLPNLGAAWVATAIACGIHLAINVNTIRAVLVHRRG